MEKIKKKVIILGLDGAPGNLVFKWAREGLLPNLGDLLKRGSWGSLISTQPPLTVPAWTSFMTGKKPEKHGLFDFIYRLPDSYDVYPVNSTLNEAETIWSILSKAGKRMGVLNVPATYPPEKVNGFMVTGMLTPERANDYTFPAQLIEKLRKNVPQYTVWPAKAYHFPGGEEKLLDFIRQVVQIRIEAMKYLMQEDGWDFFMSVFRATDVVQHWFWRFMDKNHFRNSPHESERLKNAILSVYQDIDSYLGEILASSSQETLLMIMSDHGFGPLEKYVYLNNFLLERRLLRLKKNLKARAKYTLFKIGFTPFNLYRLMLKLRMGRKIAFAAKKHRRGLRALIGKFFLSFQDVDWKNTIAYSIGNTGAIFINKRGREPGGIVAEEKEYKKVAERIVEELLNWKDPLTGDEMVSRVCGPKELPWKTSNVNFPDIYFELRNEKYFPFARYNFPSNSWIEPAFDMSGWHRRDGILVMHGQGIKKGFRIQNAHIIDLAPTLLAYLGVPIPDDMDGRVLEELFEESHFKNFPFTYTKARVMKERKSKRFSKEETEEIKRKLKDLGYFS